MQPLKLLSCAALVLPVLLASACGSDSPITKIENKISCHDVCQRYADCYDSSYDVSACTDRCTNDATDQQKKDDELKTCDDCIGGKSCTSATFNCATECSPFVP